MESSRASAEPDACLCSHQAPRDTMLWVELTQKVKGRKVKTSFTSETWGHILQQESTTTDIISMSYYVAIPHFNLALWNILLTLQDFSVTTGASERAWKTSLCSGSSLFLGDGWLIPNDYDTTKAIVILRYSDGMKEQRAAWEKWCMHILLSMATSHVAWSGSV